MSKKGMKLTGILQNHNQHPQSDQKYEPLRTNIRNSKQKPTQTEITTVSHVSSKLQSLSPQQADLIKQKKTVHIPVNCQLRVTSNEEKQHQALKRRYVAINMYEKEGSKPISPNTFEKLPKNQKQEMVYEYHCPHSQGKVEEYYSSESKSQGKRVIGDRQNYQLSDNDVVRNGGVATGQQQQSEQQFGQQKTIMRDTISPSSSSQVIRNNVSPSGQILKTKVVTQTIYGHVQGHPIQGAIPVNNNTKNNNTFAGSTIKSQSVIYYEVKSRIKSPEYNIKGGISGVKGATSAVKGKTQGVKRQSSEVQQNIGNLQGERRTQVVSGSKVKDVTKLHTIYGPSQGQPIGGGSRISIQHNRSLQGSTIKDKNSIYEHNTQNIHDRTQTIHRTTLYQDEYMANTAQDRGSIDRNSTGNISMSPIKMTTQREEVNSGRGDGSAKNTNNITVNNRDSKDQINRQSNQKDAVLVESQQNRKSTVTKEQIIYGPSEGKPIDEVVYRQNSVSNHQGQQSNLISSKVIDYDSVANKTIQPYQGIQTNTSPGTKIIQQQETQQQAKKRHVNQIQQINHNNQSSQQQMVDVQAEYIGEGKNISMQPIKITTKTQIKQNQSGKNGQSVTVVRETTNTQQIIDDNNRATSPTIQRNTNSNQQSIHGSNVPKKAIYGPRQGQPINSTAHHYGKIQVVDSTIVSSARHNVNNYSQKSPIVNQGIRMNTSPSTKLIRQGISPNGKQYQQQQQIGYQSHQEYRTGGNVGYIANDDNGNLDGPAYFETQGRMKYNQMGRNSRNENDLIATTKKQIQSGENNTGNIQIGGRSKANTRQTFQDFESNISINSRYNKKNHLNSTRQYSIRDIRSKEEMMARQQTQIKGEYRIEQDNGDLEELNNNRDYVQNVESRIIIGGNGEGRIGGTQEEIAIRGNNKKVQISKDQAEYQLKAQKLRGQNTRNSQQPTDPHNSSPFPLNISTHPAVNPSTSTNPQLQQRKKKLTQYQQTGIKGYNFKKNSVEEPQGKRKKQQYKYNLYSMLDQQFNLKCTTGLCVPNEICATVPKREGWK